MMWDPRKINGRAFMVEVLKGQMWCRPERAERAVPRYGYVTACQGSQLPGQIRDLLVNRLIFFHVVHLVKLPDRMMGI
jgi:hypothetical protein